MDPSRGEIEALQSEKERRFKAWEARETAAYNARLRGARKAKAAADRKAEREKREKDEAEKLKAEKIKLKESFRKKMAEARIKLDTRVQEAYSKADRARKEATQCLEADLKKGDQDAAKAKAKSKAKKDKISPLVLVLNYLLPCCCKVHKYKGEI
ncbi:hypothetical protein DCAR_0933514 [Daucus carota subsp. sativus]|uniref:Uncharacterized protein n=1 Tax=Daucus carota subsp. sativus TaxID=79200 RepID=A0A175YDK4_DAUCS|nr:hypothetical protein DCAR_0933514 [Daucus carota subsp. sativus]